MPRSQAHYPTQLLRHPGHCRPDRQPLGHGCADEDARKNVLLHSKDRTMTQGRRSFQQRTMCVGCACSTGTCRGLFERGNARPGYEEFGWSETRIRSCWGVAQDDGTVCRAHKTMYASQGSVSPRLVVNVRPGAQALIIGKSLCT
jgi:hypothetical protein